jgi:hypothetical protein
MKVKELIKLLEKHDPEMRVVVDGYEAGYDEVEKAILLGIGPNPKVNKFDSKFTADWEGEFIEVYVDDADEIALLLPRKN